jgi:hypothetical protein
LEDRADARCVARMATEQYQDMWRRGELGKSLVEEQNNCVADALMTLRAAQRAVAEEK